MKMTIDLPEAVVREMKLRAVLQRRTVKALVTDALMNSLGMQDSERTTSDRIEINANGFPVIRCPPDAPAAKMSAAELHRVERATLEAEDLDRAGIIA